MPPSSSKRLIVAGLALIVLASTLMAASAFAQMPFAAPRPPAAKILGEDGTPVRNHRINADQVKALARLPKSVVVGNPNGDVTLYEFYDLNCPYCRRASSDLDRLLAADKKLRVVLVPFPVLGVASIQAGRVEFVAAGRFPADRFHIFHRKIFAARGVVDGARALAVAQELGLKPQDVIAEANRDEITDQMKSHVRLGDAMGLVATPAWIAGDVVIVGHPGLEALRKIVAAQRACGKVAC